MTDKKIQVSSTRKAITYLVVCKRTLKEHGEVQLSGLGMAIGTVVTVSEILKTKKYAVERSITTSIETLEDEGKSRQKPRLEIVLEKSPEFDSLIKQEEEAAASKRAEQTPKSES